jgi:diguanylate cyclase (GGDEF)-like protein
MEDLFDFEQNILDDALVHAAITGDEKYEELAGEYGRLLRQLRRATKVSDRATITLNNSRYDLLDKVHYDALTGIYNRRYMMDSLKRVIKSLSRSKGVLSVLMIDVDFFKKYNDTYGHSEGDYCLKAVAVAISKAMMRPDDYVVRYGGEEFMVILPNTDECGAKFLAEKILENISTRKIPHSASEVSDCITVSIGITTTAVKNSHTVDDYIKQADKALYKSKQNGRNQYTFIEFYDREEAAQ